MSNQTYKPTYTKQSARSFTEPGTGGTATGFSSGGQGGTEANWEIGGMGTNWGTGSMAGTQSYGGMGTDMGMGTMGTNVGTGTNVGMGNMQQRKFGAHEMMQVHEVLTQTIDGINQFELYRPHIKDQQLMSILDKQLQHMSGSYDNMVNYLHNQGMSSAVPYRVKKSFQPQYGLRQPAPQQPNTNINQMDDRDVASGMMCCSKAGAVKCTHAALECADPTLRSIVMNCAVSAVNQAYELFQYMNQKGMYQVPTLQQNTTGTMMNAYQSAGQMQYQ